MLTRGAREVFGSWAAVLSFTLAAFAAGSCRLSEVLATGECRRKVRSTRQRKGIRPSSLRSKILLDREQANLIKQRLREFVKVNRPRKPAIFREKWPGFSSVKQANCFSLRFVFAS